LCAEEGLAALAKADSPLPQIWPAQATKLASTSSNLSQVQFSHHSIPRWYSCSLIPELQEFSRKKIFSKDEVTSITKRRSDFEHKLNARGSTTADYARYAEYEMNLESLRRKRVKRLGVETSNHTGQRRIFFILDRGTRKFQGNLGLWMQYLGFARKQRANKKVSQILTSVLRLHPTKAEMWIYAANYALEEKGDVVEARGYMQRGLRFCKGEGRLWVEYARLELIWVARIWNRRRILGVDGNRGDVDGEKRDDVEVEGIDGDVVKLPMVTEEDINPEKRAGQEVDQAALERLGKSPALSGAIPIAIFDSAMKQFKQDESLCQEFFDMVSEFQDLPCTRKILDHITEFLEIFDSPATLLRCIRQPVMGLSATSARFPTMLSICLDRMETAFKRIEPIVTAPKTSRPRAILDGYLIEWMLSYLGEKDLDRGIRKAIVMSLRKAWSQFQADIAIYPNGNAAEVSKLIGSIRAQGLHKLAEPATAWAIEMWPDEIQLISQAVQARSQ